MNADEYQQPAPRKGERNTAFIVLFAVAGFVTVCAAIAYFALFSFFDRGVTLGDAVGVVDVQGEIYFDRWKIKEIESHRKNDNVKAVVVFINSPGGGVAASQALHRALLDLRMEKPVVAFMASVAGPRMVPAALFHRRMMGAWVATSLVLSLVCSLLLPLPSLSQKNRIRSPTS